jgi:hypothetical protein
MGGNRKGQRCGEAGFQAHPGPRWILAPALVSAALTIAGCASTIADRAPTALGGLPEDAPARPSTPSAYPAVNDMPPPRSSTVLSSAEQKKLEDELAEARKRAAAAAAANGTAKPAGSAPSQ